MKRTGRIVAWAIFLLFLVSLPHLLGQDYYVHMLVMAGIYAMLAMSLALIMGLSGQVSLCHVAFYGIGAYTSALLSLNFSVPFWISFICGGLMAGLCAFLFGRVVLKFQGHFLAITTAVFGIMVMLVLNNWTSLTRGPMGLPGIPRPNPIPLFGFELQFVSRAEYYYLVLFFLLAMTYVVHRIGTSRLGKAMIAVRENEEVAQSIGVNPMKTKILAFTLGSGLAGVAGAFYAHYILFISPVSFTLGESINVLVMVVFGGMQVFVGPFVGALLLTILPEFLRMAGELRMIIYGLALMIVIIFMPLGVVGTLRQKWIERRARSVKA